MTAPDDVRARFGFTISDSEPRILAWDGDNGCRPATDEEVALWDAHADLSGEVRELVEVVRELADDLREWGATDLQLAMRAAQLDAALAKFHPTQQETK